jgi:ABC-2 type transport system ATP-binding protein
LIHRPPGLFLDEPTVGLDPATRRNLWEYIRRVQTESETTVLLTTHYLEEAEAADTICIINTGRIVSYGTPAQVKADLTEEYLLIDAADRAGLQAELARLNIPFTRPSLFRIELNGSNVHQLLKTIETPLTVVRTHAPSLEDAYLAIVERS